MPVAQPASNSDESRRYWDRVARQWTDAPRDLLWRRHSDAVNSALVERWLPVGPIPRLLKTDLFDEAVGEGLAEALCGRAERVVGIDISMDIVGSVAKRQAGVRGVCADVRSLPFADASFDAIVSNSTLDHFEEAAHIEASLHELRRVLRPGGRLLLTLDNASNPVVALRNALPMGPLESIGVVPYRVGKTVGLRALRRCLAKAGLRVTDDTTVLHCPRLIAVLASRLLERRKTSSSDSAFSDWLSRFERLHGWPTSALTGYFIAAVAVRDE